MPTRGPTRGGRGRTPRSPARSAAFDTRTPRWLGLTAREHLWLALVLVLALTLRTWHWWGQMQHNPFFAAPTMDEGMHHEWAQRIASGGGLGNEPFFRAPLYYYLLGWLYALTGVKIAFARWCGCLVGAVTCYLLAHFGVRLAGFRVGLTAGLLAAVYWPLIHYENLLLTVGLEIFLNTAMLLSLWLAVQQRSLAWAGVGGLAWGLSAIARPNVLAFAPVIALWLLVGPRWLPARRPAPRAQSAWQLALVVLGAALAIAPVTLRNRIIGGEWVLIASNGGVNFYIGNNPQADGVAAIVPGTRPDWQGGYEDTQRIPALELGRSLKPGEVSDYWFRRGLSWIASEPAAWARLTWHKFRLFWSKVEIPNNQPIRFFTRLSPSSVLYWIGFPVVAPLALAGIVLLRRDWRRWSLPLLFALVYMGTIVLFFCPARYRLPIVPVLILLAALSLVRGTEMVWRWRAGHVARGERTGAVLAAAAGLAGLVFILTNPPPLRLHQRESTGRAYQDLASFHANAWLQAPDRPAAATHRDEALRYLSRALELRPNDASLRVDRGAYLLKFGQREAAGEELALALQMAPKNALARGYYGDYLWGAGRLAEAAENYRAALQQNPTWVAPMVALGHILPQLGEADNAIHYLNSAIRLEPDQRDARQQLGSLLLRRGAYAEAAEQFRAILARQPGNAAAAHRLSVVHHQQGDNAQAVAVLRAALAHSPDNELLLRTLAWLLATSSATPPADQVEEALRLANRAVELTDSRRAAPRAALAVALGAAGRYPEAAREAEAALALARAEQAQELINELQPRIAAYREARPYSPHTAGSPATSTTPATRPVPQ